jgi:hypothetical protein
MDHKANIIEFTGRKPSKAQVLAKVKFLAAAGVTLIEVYWGENSITLDKENSNGSWYGWGWLKDISADDIAKELNKPQLSTSFKHLLREAI